MGDAGSYYVRIDTPLEYFSGISSLIQHWRRPERPDAPAPLPADDREDFIRDRKREEPNKREMPLPAPFRPLRPDDDIVTGDFDRMFLQPRSIRARSALYVSSETKRKVLEVVRKVGDQHTTATSYVENILRHHLDLYKDEINRLYQQRNPQDLL